MLLHQKKISNLLLHIPQKSSTKANDKFKRRKNRRLREFLSCIILLKTNKNSTNKINSLKSNVLCWYWKLRRQMKTYLVQPLILLHMAISGLYSLSLWLTGSILYSMLIYILRKALNENIGIKDKTKYSINSCVRQRSLDIQLVYSTYFSLNIMNTILQL